MKKLADIDFDPAQGAKELREFGALLASRAELADLQQFFKERRHLSAHMGTCGPHGAVADCLAFEFPIVGDFSADLVAGNRGPQAFLLAELEDARQNSVFSRVGDRSARDWSPRFNHGFSQIVDWFCSLDDFKRTRRFSRDFGGGHVRFSGWAYPNECGVLIDTYKGLRLGEKNHQAETFLRHNRWFVRC